MAPKRKYQSRGKSKEAQKREKKKKRTREMRNWAELPQDVLSLIFEKIGSFGILLAAQAVCRSWRRLAHEPQAWRRISLELYSWDLYHSEYDLWKIGKAAVDRSSGQLEEFIVEYFPTDELLLYMASRTTSLKRLRLISCYQVENEGLIEVVKKFPMLEELEITFDSFSKDELFETIGFSCPKLKCFRYNSLGRKHTDYDSYEVDNYSDEDAFAIAKSMSELRQLQLFANNLTNSGLQAILDGCPCLEYLDLRQCFNVKLEGSLKKRCERIQDLRLPYDSTKDYGYDDGNNDRLKRESSFDDYRDYGFFGLVNQLVHI